MSRDFWSVPDPMWAVAAQPITRTGPIKYLVFGEVVLGWVEGTSHSHAERRAARAFPDRFRLRVQSVASCEIAEADEIAIRREDRLAELARGVRLARRTGTPEGTVPPAAPALEEHP